MNKNLDDLTNKELDTLAATDIMGWHQKKEPSWVSPEGELSWVCQGEVIARVSSWTPTAEGSEHQAMVVVRKILEGNEQTKWRFLDALRDMRPQDYGILEWLLGKADFGRVMVLAALKAKGVGK